MAKGVYLGIGGVRQSKKMYVGVGGVHKVKKIFVGAGGVKLAYSGGLEKTTGVPQLALDTYVMDCVGSNNTHGIFADPYNSTIDAYNLSLVRTTPTLISKHRGYTGALTSNNNHVIFAGAMTSSMSPYNSVYAYNHSLILTNTVKLASPRWSSGTAYNPVFTLFVGGTFGSTYRQRSNAVSAFNSSLIESESYISYNKADVSGTGVGNYAIAVGGIDSDMTSRNTVEHWDTSMVRGVGTPLAVLRENAMATSVGDYALIFGGEKSGTPSGVEVYNSSMVKLSSLASLPSSSRHFKGASVGEFAMCVTSPDLNTETSTTYVYDQSLVRTTLTLDYPRIPYLTGAINVGNSHILFAGGHLANKKSVDGFSV